MSRVLARSLPSLLPIKNGLVRQPRFGVVMGQEFGLRFSYFGERLSENIRGAAMEFAPTRLEQRLVSGVVDQRVPELVARVRRDAAHVQQFRIGQAAQRPLQLWFGDGMDRVEQRIGKVAAEYGADLGN